MNLQIESYKVMLSIQNTTYNAMGVEKTYFGTMIDKGDA